MFMIKKVVHIVDNFFTLFESFHCKYAYILVYLHHQLKHKVMRIIKIPCIGITAGRLVKLANIEFRTFDQNIEMIEQFFIMESLHFDNHDGGFIDSCDSLIIDEKIQRTQEEYEEVLQKAINKAYEVLQEYVEEYKNYGI